MRRELRDRPKIGEAASWHGPQDNPASPTINRMMVSFHPFPSLSQLRRQALAKPADLGR